MRKVFLFIILTLMCLTGLRAQAAEFDLLVLPTNLLSVCENYFCFPEASEIISQDTISYLNSYKNIHAQDISYVREKLNKNPQLRAMTNSMLSAYKINEHVDFQTLKALSNEFGVKSVAIISSYAATDKADIRRDLWDILELSSAFKFTYPFELKVNAILTDTVNNTVMWSSKYSKGLSDSQGYFAVTNQAQAISQLEKIKEYSKENISKNISQNIHLRFFPREVRTFDLVKPEFKNNNTYTPNALERLSEPRHQRELQEQERHFDYSYGDDLFSF